MLSFNKMFFGGGVLDLPLSKNCKKKKVDQKNNLKYELMSEVKWLNSDIEFKQ